jgi:hypothetical protein
VWDYASAGPGGVPADMNPVRFGPHGELNPHVFKDAIFLSPHKFPGGVGSPGVLIAKRRLFANAVPAEPGGGSVFFVTAQVCCLLVLPPCPRFYSASICVL